jgi:hypothetical protein
MIVAGLKREKFDENPRHASENDHDMVVSNSSLPNLPKSREGTYSFNPGLDGS